MVPPVGTRRRHCEVCQLITNTCDVLQSVSISLQVLLHLLVQSVLQVCDQHLLVEVLQGLTGRPHLRCPKLRV